MSSQTYISQQLSQLNSALSSDDKPDTLTRYIGGHTRKNQPFISGYHQCIFSLPEGLFSSTADASNANSWLMSTCEGFTPHSISMNMIDVNGIGQIGASFPTARVVNREFTLTFREYQKLPILNIIRMWHSLFDPHIGVSGGLTAAEFIPVNYKGLVAVAILKPTYDNDGAITVDDLEEGYIYEGVFPTVCPDDTATAADQMSNESIQESITFRFDGYPLTLSNDGVADWFVSQLSGLKYLGSTSYNTIS